jgi:hypothetical protein
MIVVVFGLRLLNMIVPSAAPLQVTFVELAVTVVIFGSVIDTEAIAVQEPSLLPLGALAVIT